MANFARIMVNQCSTTKKERNEWRLTLHDHIKSKEKPQITTGLAN